MRRNESHSSDQDDKQQGEKVQKHEIHHNKSN